MNIQTGIRIIDLALYLEKEKTLIIADIHIGYEESLNKQGILVPRFHFKDLVERTEEIMAQVKDVDTIIVNGDLKHEFGVISDQEWRETLKFIDLLASKSKKLILLKGNHDTILGPIASKKSIKVMEHYYIRDSNTYICHGDKLPSDEEFKKSETVIIAHEHPAVSIHEGVRVEKFKCYLKGQYNNKKLIVQPSFNSLIEGTDIQKEEILSPFLLQNLENFDVFIAADRVYEFGKLKNLKRDYL